MRVRNGVFQYFRRRDRTHAEGMTKRIYISEGTGRTGREVPRGRQKDSDGVWARGA